MNDTDNELNKEISEEELITSIRQFLSARRSLATSIFLLFSSTIIMMLYVFCHDYTFLKVLWIITVGAFLVGTILDIKNYSMKKKRLKDLHIL